MVSALEIPTSMPNGMPACLSIKNEISVFLLFLCVNVFVVVSSMERSAFAVTASRSLPSHRRAENAYTI